MNLRTLGKSYEQIAAAFMQQQGYTILESNYHCRFAELDLVATESGYLCFVEVKYRENTNYGAPQGVITPGKTRRICQAALFYMKEKHISVERPIRFDVVMIIENKIRIYKNAFEFQN